MLYKRVLLKLSGEALMGQGTHGIDPAVALRLADEIHAVASQG
ncbi:MAG: UMP kinase, partial [Gammaproteobacteria bacterium]|nr:UMP kinase [Gammaproteobacteria bacterium]